MDLNEKNISRRGFLKTAAAIGTALAVEPMLEKVQAANRLVAKENYRVPTQHEGMQYRTLGSGSASMTVSALGFGCMGMTYNRSQHPSKEQMTNAVVTKDVPPYAVVAGNPAKIIKYIEH